MSHTDLHLRTLQGVADEVASAIDEKGHKVELAMEVDEAFSSAQARAMLFRDIVTEGAYRAASRLGGIDYRPVNGSGRELRALVGNTDRRYRIKRAARVGDELRIRANSDSALVISEPDDELLFGNQEQWVFGWSLSDSEQIDEIFVAKVLGVTETKPHWLILGPQTTLLAGPGDPSDEDEFHPFDDGGLPGFGGTTEGGETASGQSS